jgi:hypothetical protein
MGDYSTCGWSPFLWLYFQQLVTWRFVAHAQFVLRPLQPSSLRYFGTAPTNDFTALRVDRFVHQRAPIAGFSTSSLELFPVSSREKTASRVEQTTENHPKMLRQ